MSGPTLTLTIDARGAEIGAQRMNRALDMVRTGTRTTDDAIGQMTDKLRNMERVANPVSNAVGAVEANVRRLKMELLDLDRASERVSRGVGRWTGIERPLIDGISGRWRGTGADTSAYAQMLGAERVRSIQFNPEYGGVGPNPRGLPSAPQNDILNSLGEPFLRLLTRQSAALNGEETYLDNSSEGFVGEYADIVDEMNDSFDRYLIAQGNIIDLFGRREISRAFELPGMFFRITDIDNRRGDNIEEAVGLHEQQMAEWRRLVVRRDESADQLADDIFEPLHDTIVSVRHLHEDLSVGLGTVQDLERRSSQDPNATEHEREFLPSLLADISEAERIVGGWLSQLESYSTELFETPSVADQVDQTPERRLEELARIHNDRLDRLEINLLAPQALGDTDRVRELERRAEFLDERFARQVEQIFGDMLLESRDAAEEAERYVTEFERRREDGGSGNLGGGVLAGDQPGSTLQTPDQRLEELARIHNDRLDRFEINLLAPQAFGDTDRVRQLERRSEFFNERFARQVERIFMDMFADQRDTAEAAEEFLNEFERQRAGDSSGSVDMNDVVAPIGPVANQGIRTAPSFGVGQGAQLTSNLHFASLAFTGDMMPGGFLAAPMPNEEQNEAVMALAQAYQAQADTVANDYTPAIEEAAGSTSVQSEALLVQSEALAASYTPATKEAVDATKEMADAALGLDQALQNPDAAAVAEEMEELSALGQQVGNSFASAFERAVLSGEELSDVLSALALDLAKLVL
ncbi:MAG: hypothetical protein AAF414_13260, partial [Pseudomonadota bacterium]